mgnify:CR=1 FL=1
MDVDVLRNIEAHELGPKVLGASDDLLGNDPLLDDPLAVIDVMQEQVESREPLNQAALDVLPFIRRDNPWNEIEGKDTLGSFIATVDGEGDPLV